jgi:hypothetical protein
VSAARTRQEGSFSYSPLSRKKISSMRFAPHLEKCLGRGGRGSRVRQVVAAAPTIVDAFDSDGGDRDDDDVYKPATNLYEKEKKKRKKDRPIDSYFK